MSVPYSGCILSPLILIMSKGVAIPQTKSLNALDLQGVQWVLVTEKEVGI